MNYPDKFKERVIAALGDDESIRSKLESGSQMIGRYLDDASRTFTAEEIIEAVDNNTIEQLYAKAKKVAELHDLYREYDSIERDQHPERFEL